MGYRRNEYISLAYFLAFLPQGNAWASGARTSSTGRACHSSGCSRRNLATIAFTVSEENPVLGHHRFWSVAKATPLVKPWNDAVFQIAVVFSILLPFLNTCSQSAAHWASAGPFIPQSPRDSAFVPALINEPMEKNIMVISFFIQPFPYGWIIVVRTLFSLRHHVQISQNSDNSRDASNSCGKPSGYSRRLCSTRDGFIAPELQ